MAVGAAPTPGIVLVNPSQMLRRALRSINIDEKTQNRRLRSTNIRTFKANFGKHPLHLCRVWRDLQTTNIEAAKIDQAEASSPKAYKGFLIANHFLKTYGSDDVRAAQFGGMDPKLLNTLTWIYVRKIAALKPDKIVWPDEDEWQTVFIASVDGTHYRTNEPRDPDMRKNPKNYSHKFHLPGLNYEITLHLWLPRCIHAKTGDPASINDKTAFRQELKGKVPLGKRIICDNGYVCFQYGDDKILSFPNTLDTAELKEFKQLACARQENFNKRLKDYRCLRDTFRHGAAKHQVCFDAVLVLVQYAIEDTTPGIGEPLNQL